MAERRMFTQKIIDSDAFLDMPLSTQALYFHLNMRADDDGFVNNPKKIQRMIGASEDDLKLLLAKRFILGFENGVIVIKHWRMHNLIRKDRYNPTTYIKEKETLAVNDNGSYTEKPLGDTLATTWQPNGNQMATQVREGKVSIVKESIGKEREGEEREAQEQCQQIVDMFNSLCPSFPSVKKLSESRKNEILERLKTYSIDDFKTCFEKAEASSFLKGKNKREWTATFDWIIQDTNMAKILEGNFDDKKSQYDLMFEAALERTYEEDDDEPPKTLADDEALRERAETLKKILSK